MWDRNDAATSASFALGEPAPCAEDAPAARAEPRGAGAEASCQPPASARPLFERAAAEGSALSPIEPARGAVPSGTLTEASRQLPTRLTPEAEGEITVCRHFKPLRVDVSFYAAVGDYHRFW